jgi:hypothetical protein
MLYPRKEVVKRYEKNPILTARALLLAVSSEKPFTNSFLSARYGKAKRRETVRESYFFLTHAPN